MRRQQSKRTGRRYWRRRSQRRAVVRVLRSSRGQSTAEFAIVLVPLCLLLFAIIQLGIVFNNYEQVTDSARAGARRGAISRQTPSPTNACIQEARTSAAALNQGQLGVTCNSAWNRGDRLTVTVTYPYEISLLGIVVKSGNLRAVTTEPVE